MPTSQCSLVTNQKKRAQLALMGVGMVGFYEIWDLSSHVGSMRFW